MHIFWQLMDPWDGTKRGESRWKLSMVGFWNNRLLELRTNIVASKIFNWGLSLKMGGVQMPLLGYMDRKMSRTNLKKAKIENLLFVYLRGIINVQNILNEELVMG